MLNEQQLKAHYNGIGGSMASSILGVNEFQTNVDAYLLLTDEDYRAKQQVEIGRKMQVKIGNALEPIVADQIQKEKGWDLVIDEQTFIDKEFPFLVGHVDRLIRGTNELVEIKTRGMYGAIGYGEEDTDNVKDSEYIQCMHYMMLTGCERAHLAVLILATSEIKYFIIERNEEVIQNMRETLVNFWQENVLKRVPPTPLSYSEACKLWPKSGDIERDASASVEQLVVKAKELAEQFKSVEATLDYTKTQIADYLKDADTLIGTNGSPICTWKTQTANRIDADLLRSKYPAIATECTKQSTSRVMRFKK